MQHSRGSRRAAQSRSGDTELTFHHGYSHDKDPVPCPNLYNDAMYSVFNLEIAAKGWRTSKNYQSTGHSCHKDFFRESGNLL